jgi:phosphoglycolate phosphatase
MKTIIFDFDGVIHDTFELAYRINIDFLDKNLTKEKYRDFFNGNIFENAEVDEDDNDKFFKLQNEAFKYLKIDENIKKNLEKLSKEFPLFIVSSNQEEALDIYFQNNKFLHIFREILGSKTHKSKVEKFKYLFKKYCLNPGDCVFVTDTLGDILEGNKAGVKTIAVDFGFHGRDRLEKGKPFRIVSSFEEVIETIDSI